MIRDFDFESEKIAIFGASGMGKSYLQRQLLLSLPADYTFLFDHKGQFKKLCGFPFHCRTDADMDAALEQTGLVCYLPAGCSVKAECERWMEKVFGVCKNLKGRKRIGFDEGGLLLPRTPSKPKEKKDAAGNPLPNDFWHPFQAIQETGREFGIDVLATSQRPVHFCPDFRGQFTRIVCFQMPAGWIQPLIADYGEERFLQVTELRKGQWLAYTPDTGEFEEGGTIIE